MKAIVFYCVDNFGRNYTSVSVCRDEIVKGVVEDAFSKSTEILAHDVVDATLSDAGVISFHMEEN